MLHHMAIQALIHHMQVLYILLLINTVRCAKVESYLLFTAVIPDHQQTKQNWHTKTLTHTQPTIQTVGPKILDLLYNYFLFKPVLSNILKTQVKKNITTVRKKKHTLLPYLN